MSKFRFPSCPVVVALCLGCFALGCTGGDSLRDIQASGELRVVSRNGPTTYYQDRNGAAGFEYELASLLATDLGVRLNMQPAFSLDAIFRQLQRNEADLAAAGLTLTESRANAYPHATSYSRLSPQII